jgi:hypothetical protein
MSRRSRAGKTKQPLSFHSILLLCAHDTKQIEHVGIAWRRGKQRLEETLSRWQITLINCLNRFP